VGRWAVGAKKDLEGVKVISRIDCSTQNPIERTYHLDRKANGTQNSACPIKSPFKILK
jgi:hypothetical protein